MQYSIYVENYIAIFYILLFLEYVQFTRMLHRHYVYIIYIIIYAYYMDIMSKTCSIQTQTSVLHKILCQIWISNKVYMDVFRKVEAM